jgi:hypothetical protein
MRDSSHLGVGTEDVGHALHLQTEQVLSCMNYYQLQDECPECVCQHFISDYKKDPDPSADQLHPLSSPCSPPVTRRTLPGWRKSCQSYALVVLPGDEQNRVSCSFRV